MSFDHRPDSTRNPYAQKLDDDSLDAWDDDALWRLERRFLEDGRAEDEAWETCERLSSYRKRQEDEAA